MSQKRGLFAGDQAPTKVFYIYFRKVRQKPKTIRKKKIKEALNFVRGPPFIFFKWGFVNPRRKLFKKRCIVYIYYNIYITILSNI